MTIGVSVTKPLNYASSVHNTAIVSSHDHEQLNILRPANTCVCRKNNKSYRAFRRMVQEVIMSDAGSGSRFPFLKRNRNDDTPSDFSGRFLDLNSPVTGEINQIFTPSQPRHAAAPQRRH